MIQAFDKATLNALRADLAAALAPVAAKHGISLEAGAITYSANACTIKVEAKTEGGVEVTRSLLAMHGLEMGKVSPDGFTLTGFDAKRRTRPYVAEKDGRSFVFDSVGAKMRWAKAAA